MKPIVIRVTRGFNDLDSEQLIEQYEVDVFKAGVKYWTKRVNGEEALHGTLDFMVAIFEACGITPQVVL